MAPGLTTTEAPLDVAALHRQLARVDEAMRVVAYYRADPEARPGHDLVRAALLPLRGG